MSEERLILGEEVKELNYKVKPGDIIWNVTDKSVVIPFPVDYYEVYQFTKSIRELALEERP